MGDEPNRWLCDCLGGSQSSRQCCNVCLCTKGHDRTRGCRGSLLGRLRLIDLLGAWQLVNISCRQRGTRRATPNVLFVICRRVNVKLETVHPRLRARPGGRCPGQGEVCGGVFVRTGGGVV